MKDMNYLAKILYPDDLEQDTASQEAGPVSSPTGRHSQSQTQGNRHASDRASDTTHSSSSTGGRRSSTGSSISTKSHPLHRDDPLYDAVDAQEQVRIITERAKLMKDQKDAVKTQQTQNQTQTQNTQNTQRNTQGGSSSGAGVSRRTASGRAAQTVSAPPSQPVAPTESRRAVHARLNPNGSSSSSQWMDAHATSSSSNGTGSNFFLLKCAVIFLMISVRLIDDHYLFLSQALPALPRLLLPPLAPLHRRAPPPPLPTLPPSPVLLRMVP